jgi:hypothetical protein
MKEGRKEGRWKIELCDLVNHDKMGLGNKAQYFEI